LFQGEGHHLPPSLAQPGPYLALPGWLADALLHRCDGTTGVLGSGVLPRLDRSELSILAGIVSHLQSQLHESNYQGPKFRFKLRLDLLGRLLPIDSSHGITKIGRLLEQLSSLRFLVDEENRLEPYYLFGGESWELPNIGDLSELQLKLGSGTHEMLFGFCDGHSELVRRIEGQPILSKIIGRSGPVILWSSIWNDLKSQDQDFYLRLERLIQSSAVSSVLESRFVLPISELLGLRGAAFSNVSGGVESDFLENLRQMARIGRKLVEHGLLSRENLQEFSRSVPGRVIKEPMMAGSLTEQRRQGLRESEFYTKSFESYLRSVELAQYAKLWSSLVPLDGNGEFFVEAVMRQLIHEPNGLVRIGSTAVIQLKNLFMEWMLRSLPGSLFPLSGSIQNHELIRMCFFSQEASIRSQYERFLAAASHGQIVFELISKHPEVTLTTESFERNLTPLSTKSIPQSVSQTPVVPLSVFHVPVVQAPVAGEGVMQNQSLSPRTIEFRPLAAPVEMPMKSSFGGNISTDSRLQRIALDELERMMKTDKRAYQSLKSVYYNSLAESQRELLTDVERRLRPNVFDQQLKQRLVKFMVSSPGEWKSSRSSLQ
jgi:hypothetical protein